PRQDGEGSRRRDGPRARRRKAHHPNGTRRQGRLGEDRERVLAAADRPWRRAPHHHRSRRHRRHRRRTGARGDGSWRERAGCHRRHRADPHRLGRTEGAVMTDVVIVAAARTPQGRLKGQLASFTAPQLGSFAIKGALEQASIDPEAVDAVIVGQVLAAGSGQNAARQAAIGAGIGWDVPAHSVNKVCLSGLTAIIDAARMIRTGDATTVVAAGMESMTRAPHLLVGSRDGWTYGSVEVLDHMAYDGLTDAYDNESMGASTERHNERFELTREAQDEVAALSHQRAAVASDAGVFDDEIVTVEVPQRRGEPIIVTRDEGVRPETTVETLSKLRAAFAEGGSITAGNSSQISDGASAVVLTT